MAVAMRKAREFGKLAEKSQVVAWVKMNWDRATTALNVMNNYEPFYDVEGEQWQGVVAAFSEFKRLSVDQDFQLLVVVFPMLFNFDDYPFAPHKSQVLAMLEDVGIEYIDLLPAYSRAHRAEDFRILSDDATHPNELGHRIAAQEIDLFLRNSGWLH